MSAAVLANNSMFQSSDALRFAEFKAKRAAQKEAQKEKLATEFPLLFGKDAKARSTVGKYANKNPTTPSKKKPLGNSSTPVSKQANELSKRTPRKEANNMNNATPVASKKIPANNNNKSGSLKVQNNNENKNVNINTNKPVVTKKPNGKGFFNFLSSKSNEEVVDPVEPRSKSSDAEDGIEIPTMISTIDRQVLFSVISEDSLQPQISAEEILPSLSSEVAEQIHKDDFEVIIEDKVQDALDYMLECNELDANAHRRLSGQRFSKEVIRRFSSSDLIGRLSSTNNKTAISTDIDFHAISRDICEEETMMLAQRSLAPVHQLNGSPAFSDDGYFAAAVSVMSNPNPTPVAQAEQHCDEPELTTVVSNTAVENDNPSISTNNEVTTAEAEIGDLEVLYALRNYISSLEEVTYYNNPMRHPSYLQKRKSTLSEEASKFIGTEQELTEEHACGATFPEALPATDEQPTSCFQDHNATTDLNSSSTEEKQGNLFDLSRQCVAETPLSFLPNGIAENKIITFPRHALFEKVLKLGLVCGEIISRVRCENHVKYAVDVQIFPSPGLDTSILNTRMMLLKRFTEFKEFREQLILCQVGNEDAEPIPSLPSKQSMSLSRDCNEDEYLNSRQKHLNTWLSSILARQSYETDNYRDTIYDFFSN